VLFPTAAVKVFLVATVDERARRRQKELVARGDAQPLAEVRAEIEARDRRRDRERNIAPLVPAADATVVDTSGMTVDEQVQAVLHAVAPASARTEAVPRMRPGYARRTRHGRRPARRPAQAPGHRPRARA